MQNVLKGATTSFHAVRHFCQKVPRFAPPGRGGAVAGHTGPTSPEWHGGRNGVEGLVWRMAVPVGARAV